MATISEALDWAAELFSSADPSENLDIKIDAEVLLSHVTEKQRSYFYTWPESRLTLQQWQLYQSLCRRRQAGEPVAYIVGYREFWTLKLKVNKHVLIPRPETELLVETALEKMSDKGASVIDLGTGSGAIALALASERKGWLITATDISHEALTVARDNAMLNGINHVSFFQGSWCQPVSGRLFDLVVANPPYIAPDDKHLTIGDVRSEPDIALISAQEGLADIRAIASQAQRVLKSDGWLLVEHGYNQGASVSQIFDQEGYRNIDTVTDLGCHERVTMGQKYAG